MSDVVHLYCDESCHLLHDHQKAMVLGAVWCDAVYRAALGDKIKSLKREFGLSPFFEVKWTKVSPARLDFYLALVDLFFSERLFHFRGVVVPDKSTLDHERFNQTHDEFYYKMWFWLLTYLIDPMHKFRIFLDIKDSHGQRKIERLHEVLRSSHLDFDRRIIRDIQVVRSHEVPIMQMTDLLAGALSYIHRNKSGSPAKQAVIERIRLLSKHNLLRSTLPREQKFNVFVWHAQEKQ